MLLRFYQEDKKIKNKTSAYLSPEALSFAPLNSSCKKWKKKTNINNSLFELWSISPLAQCILWLNNGFHHTFEWKPVYNCNFQRNQLHPTQYNYWSKIDVRICKYCMYECKWILCLVRCCLRLSIINEYQRALCGNVRLQIGFTITSNIVQTFRTSSLPRQIKENVRWRRFVVVFPSFSVWGAEA